MSFTLRDATADDLDAVAELTKASRRQLAEWSPTWWRPGPGADELHPLWLGHLIGSDGPVVRVAVDGGAVVGCAVSMPQPQQWFVDDVTMVDDARWAADGEAFLRAVPERPALTCVPVRDRAKTAAARAAGLTLVATYWIGPAVAGDTSVEPLPAGTTVPTAAPHTFGGPFDPAADGALAFAAAGGIVVGSPPVHAPPVYDPSGTVTIVDRIVGPDRAALLRAAIGVAGNRGDTLVAVVAATEDRDLQDLLQAAELVPTVGVHRWPR